MASKTPPAGSYTNSDVILAPTVTTISPSSGVVTGGTMITITGTGFVEGTTVTIGGNPATDITVASATSITAKTPAGKVGESDVVVTNPDGQFGTLTRLMNWYDFNFDTGYNLKAGTSYAICYRAPDATFSDSVWYAVDPSGTYLGGWVVQSYSAGISWSDTPYDASFEVWGNNLDTSTQTSSPIEYENYENSTAADDIFANTWKSQTFTPSIDHTVQLVRLRLIKQGNPIGDVVVSIRVTDTSGRPTGNDLASASIPCSRLTGWFTYEPAPTVESISPISGPTLGGTTITIKGTNFLRGTTVMIGGAAATNVTVVDDTSITATTTLGKAGSNDVVVTSPVGTAILIGAFTYVPVRIVVASISPTSGPTKGGTAVNIIGENFVNETTITIGGNPATDIRVMSATSITAKTPAGKAGESDVVLTNPDGEFGNLKNGFIYVAAPTVTTISPSSGVVTGGTMVTITGTGFVEGTTVTIGGNPATDITVASATSITAKTPAGKVGDNDVVVTNPDGQFGTLTRLMNWYDFNFDTGYNLKAGTRYAICYRAPDATLSDSVWYAVDPSGTYLGGWGVLSYSAGVSWSDSPYDASFEVWGNNPDTPTQTSSPIEYENYENSTAVDDIFANTWKSQIFTPSIDHTVQLVRLRLIKQGNPVGDVVMSIRVTDTDGRPTGNDLVSASIPCSNLVGGFTYDPAPTVESISPTSGPTEGGTMLTIKGTNFTSGTAVMIGGVAATNVTVVDDTSITATTTVGTDGARDVVVITPGGTAILIGAFTYMATIIGIGSISVENTNGVFTRTTILKSLDGNAIVSINAGNFGKTLDGLSLNTIAVTLQDKPPSSPTIRVGETYNFGPQGATFDQPVTITMHYNPANIPTGVDETNMFIAFYNTTLDHWVRLANCVVDPVAHTVTVPVTHFTLFTVMTSMPTPVNWRLMYVIIIMSIVVVFVIYWIFFNAMGHNAQKGKLFSTRKEELTKIKRNTTK